MACPSPELTGALVAVTAAVTALTAEAKRRWDTQRVRQGRRPDRRSGRR